MPHISIRNKLFIAFSLLGLLALATSYLFVYSTTRDTIQASIQTELNNSTTLITNLVQSVATTSIENHLESISQTQLLQVSSMYEEYLAGRISEGEAKRLAAKTLLKQDIGTSGYFYCIDSQGNVVVHRSEEVQGTNALNFEFVRQQTELKTGYIEYRWKNPGEQEKREKALFMVYFQPWDWIISASTYKSEFTHLIDIDKLEKALSQVSFGEHGYPFIMRTDGEYIYHPALKGNIYELGLDQALLATGKKILQQEQGVIFYDWKNPQEEKIRKKISFINHLADYNWVVGSSAYLDELYQPLFKVQKIFLTIFLLYGALILSANFGLSTLFTKPLKKLIEHFRDKPATGVSPITINFSNDEVGKLAGYLNQFIDKLNEHHQTLENEIRERKRSEQTFHTLFDHSFQMIALLDPDCKIQKINQTALNLGKLEEKDVLGKYFWTPSWWGKSEELVEQLKSAYAVARKGKVIRFEGHSNVGVETHFDISMKPVLDDNQQVIHIIAEAREVTELRQAERELQQAQKMESVGMLAGGIAHDFNNILGGILGTIGLLKLKRKKGVTLPEEKLFSHLDTINATALRAKDMVNQLLTLSRKYDLDIIPINLSDVLQHVCRIGRSSFDKSIDIVTDYDQRIPVKGDINSLEQVFLNICINAAHAMTIMRPPSAPWGGTLKICVNTCTEGPQIGHGAGSYWRISISDTGVGMDKAGLEQIFIPFYSTKSKYAGTGLGLSMVYNIVKQHNGFIDVESQPQQGTTFHIYLPECDDEQSAAANDDEMALVKGDGLILVIDDEELIRNSACEILAECGYQTLSAENGQQGLEIYQQQQNGIGAVLLDLVMPQLSGKETFAALKKINPEVKILLSSGFRHDSRVDEILNSGAKGFIQKPYSLYGLSKATRDVLLT